MIGELIADLRARGVVLTAEGDSLRYDGPDGAITTEDLEGLRANKAAILALLREAPVAISAEAEAISPPTPARVEAAPTSADCWPALCFYGHIPRWQRPDGGWVCAVCHPPVNGELVVGLAGDPQAALVELTEGPGWDPRPELTEDSTLWARLLALAYEVDGTAPDGMYGALDGMRCMGAGLGVVGGKLKLTAGAMDPEEYGQDCTKYLMPHRTALAELLRRLDAPAEEKAA